jgi:hypothetical protein
VSVVSKQANLSVFAYYLSAGLSGQAEGYHRQSKTGYVSVEDLAAFVKERVDRWARRNGFGGQRPVLLGQAKDFNLVALTGTQAAPPAAKLEDLPK